MSSRRRHHDRLRNGGASDPNGLGVIAAYPSVDAGYGADGDPAAAASPAVAVLTQAAQASAGDHPAVPAALMNAAAAAKGALPPMPPPVGPQDAAALLQAAQASKQQNDHPIVTAALATAAQAASSNGTKVAQVLTQASQVSASSKDHAAVTNALTNGAAKAMGAPPPAPIPTGPDAAIALSSAANVSASKNDHPVVTATLADAAAKASAPAVAAVLAKAAGGPDMTMHPAAAQALAKAAVANAPPKPGAMPSYANLPGAPSPPPIPKGPPSMPTAAYPEGAPPSPPAASPPPPPALAAIPPAQATAIEASTLATLTPKDGVDLQPGETLEGGHYIPGHRQGRHGGPRHKLVMQHDGNLVLYHDMTPIWASHTGGTGARRARMRTDGNFVLEDDHGHVVWASGGRTPGSFVVLQDDGNFVQYHGNRALWASHQDSRGRGQDMRRIGNVFLGGARHYGHHRGGSSFGAEAVRDERVFRKVAAHMRNAVHERHRRGLDLSLETSTGMYTPEEVQFAVSRLSPDDRAGFAAGTALKIGLAHPAFGNHMRTHFHGELGHDDVQFGDDMGFEWRFWRWFGLGGHDNDIQVAQLPPDAPPPDVVPIAGPAAAAPPSPPPQSGAAPAPVNPPPPPPPSNPAQPDSDGLVITEVLTLPDGSVVQPPQFRDWAARRRWEMDQRRRWQQRFHLPVTGLPNWNDPLVFADGMAAPLPPGGFRDWGTRQAWEARQRAIWRQNGGHFPGAVPPPPIEAYRAGLDRSRVVADRIARAAGLPSPYAPRMSAPTIVRPDGLHDNMLPRDRAPISSGIGTPIVRAPVSPLASPPPPGVPSAPMHIMQPEPEPHPFAPENAHAAPSEMSAPHEESARVVDEAPPAVSAPETASQHMGSHASRGAAAHGDMGSEYSMSEHMQMDMGVDANVQFGVDGNFQFGADDVTDVVLQAGLVAATNGTTVPQVLAQASQAAAGAGDGRTVARVLHRASEVANATGMSVTDVLGQASQMASQAAFGLEQAAIDSLADGDMWNQYRAFPNQTGFGGGDMGFEWPWHRRQAMFAQRQQQYGLVPYGQQPLPPGVLPPPPPPPGEGALVRRRDRRYFAGADPVASATNNAALQAAGAAAAIGSTVLGPDSQKAALSVIMSHVHMRVGALSTGIGNVWHKLVGLFDHIIHPDVAKATVAPDGKGGLVTTLPTTTITGKAV